MITAWVAIVIVVAVGGLLPYWHFSGAQLFVIDRRRKDANFFDGTSGVGHDNHGGHSPGGGDGDGGSGH